MSNPKLTKTAVQIKYWSDDGYKSDMIIKGGGNGWATSQSRLCRLRHHCCKGSKNSSDSATCSDSQSRQMSALQPLTPA